MVKIHKLELLEKYWNDNVSMGFEPDGPYSWEDLINWWQTDENKVDWKDSWAKGILSELTNSGMHFYFYCSEGGLWDDELTCFMQTWIELPPKFADDYCLYINDDKKVTAIAHWSLAKKFKDHSLLAGGVWFGLDNPTNDDSRVAVRKSLPYRKNDKLLLSIGEKFKGDFTEAEFIQHAMATMKEEATKT